MMRWIRSLDRRAVVTLCLYALCSFIFAKVYFLTTREWRQSTAQQLVDFTAYKPFQYRVLVPAVMRLVRDVLHLNVETIFKGSTVLSTMLTLICFRWLLDRVFRWRFADLAALFILYPMAWNYCAYGYFRTPYDLPAMIFFMVGLIALLERRWWLFYLAFTAGVFNRETIVCLTGVFVLLNTRRWRRPSVLLHLALQIVIWAAVKYSLSLIFLRNDGNLFQHQIGENLKLLGNPRMWPPYLFAFGALWALVLWSWRDIDPLVRRMLWIAPPFCALMAYVGNLHELRIYNELVPLFALAGVSALGAIFGFRVGDRPAEQLVERRGGALAGECAK